jgi:hypothetical protein
MQLWASAGCCSIFAKKTGSFSRYSIRSMPEFFPLPQALVSPLIWHDIFYLTKNSFMNAKNGHTIPAPLSRELEKNKKAAAVFGSMRPSCQQKYMDMVKNVQAGERKTKTPKVINSILEYGSRHPAH